MESWIALCGVAFPMGLLFTYVFLDVLLSSAWSWSPLVARRSTPSETLRTYAHVMPDAHDQVRPALDVVEPGHVWGTRSASHVPDLGG